MTSARRIHRRGGGAREEKQSDKGASQESKAAQRDSTWALVSSGSRKGGVCIESATVAASKARQEWLRSVSLPEVDGSDVNVESDCDCDDNSGCNSG